MSTQWEGQNRTAAKRAAALFRRQSERIPLRHRIDVVLMTGLVLGLIILVGSLFAFVEIGERFAWFEAPIIQPIADERILLNVRDEIADQSLLDAVLHEPDGRVYISQEGGTLHEYNPSTGLWSSERPFSEEEPINKDLVMLRSGCGSDPLSHRAADCPDAQSLWAISAEGGLARRVDSDWEIVVSDTAFKGASGSLIESDDLTAAAVSPDKRWLLVGTQDDGIGLYNIERHQWLPLGEDFLSALPSLSVTHLVWWQGRFWIGGPSGLISLTIENGDNGENGTPRFSEAPTITHEVLDLDADPSEGLWILAQRGCDQGGEGCLWLGKLSAADEEPVVMMNERNRFPELSLTELTFAQHWQDQLTVAGDAGIFSYDTLSHNWERHFSKSVATTLALPDGNGFYFGFGGGIGLIQNNQDNQLRSWEIADERMVKLLYGDNGDVLALTERGNLFALSPEGRVSLVFEASGTRFEPEGFTTAVALGDTVFFIGDEGALLHNTATRRYIDIASNWLPEWLRDSAVQLISAGDHVYVLSTANTSQNAVYTLPANKMAQADYFMNREWQDVSPLWVPAPISRVFPWGGQGIGLLAGDGSLYRFTPQGRQKLTGEAVPELDQIPFLDVTALNDDLVVATERGLRRYESDDRAWNVIALPDDTQPLQLDSFNGKILIHSDQGTLLQSGDGNPIQLIGDERGIGISDEGLSDAQVFGQSFYLAGEGKVEQYDSDRRRITKQWALPGNGSVSLQGLINQQPLALSEGIATLGEKVIDTQAGPVSSLSADDKYIWTVRESEVGPYLRGHPIASSLTAANARCFFRQPSAGVDVTQLLDARSLPSGEVAVATNAGLRFYDPLSRSWFFAPSDLIPAGGRVYRFDEHLLLSEERDNDFRLSFIPLDSITIPGSCSNDVVSLQEESVVAKAVAIDESRERVAWLRADGAVIEWQAGQEKELLPATTDAPARAELRRAYERSSNLLFTTDNDIWRYDLGERQWEEISLEFETEETEIGAISEMNLERASSREMVLVGSDNGEFYLGSFNSVQSSVSMSRIFTPPSVTFNASADALLDVQEGQNRLWTFVLEDRIKYFNPVERTWLPEAEFPAADPSRSYQRAAGRAVVVANEEQVWWVAQERNFAPTRFARYDLQANETTALDEGSTIWRLPADGRLLTCPAPVEGEYSCETYGPPTFYLEPNEVQHAFAWQELILFESNQGIRAFDSSSRVEVPLPATVAAFVGVTVARQVGQQLWLYGSDSLLILERTPDNDNQVVERLFTGAGIGFRS